MNRLMWVFALLGISSIGWGQKPYAWINVPYNPQNLSQIALPNQLQFEGKVKHITEEIELFTTRQNESWYELEMMINEKGKITTYRKHYANDVIFLESYHYDHSDQLEYIAVQSDDGLKPRMDWVHDTLFSTRLDAFGPDSSFFDLHGNMTYAKYARAEVYSFYDEFNRKVRDSIPVGIVTMAHEINYIYKRKKIIIETLYSNENIRIEETYTLDEMGNWVSRTIESNDRRRNARITREIEYYK